VYAFGASMGGQESLLLVARNPALPAGVAAFDAVTDMAKRTAISHMSAAIAAALRAGGPNSDTVCAARARRDRRDTAHRRARIRAAARLVRPHDRSVRRSASTLVEQKDRVVDPRDQSVPFVRALQRSSSTRRWRRSSGRGRTLPTCTSTTSDSGAAAVRPPAVASHEQPASSATSPSPAVALGCTRRRRRLPPWYRSSAGLGYDRVPASVELRERGARNVYLRYAVFDGNSLRGGYWQHNPAFLNAAFVDSAIAWYPYSGDRRAIAAVRTMLDYQLAHGTTPARWSWPRVPFATGCAGENAYGRCLAGLPRRFYGGTEPDKVGLLGRGYLLFYELTGDRRYLRAAIHAADALARTCAPETRRTHPGRPGRRRSRSSTARSSAARSSGRSSCSTI
jgi:hypothetical protein